MPLLLREDLPEVPSGGKAFLQLDPMEYLQSLLQLGTGMQMQSNIETGSETGEVAEIDCRVLRMWSDAR